MKKAKIERAIDYYEILLETCKTMMIKTKSEIWEMEAKDAELVLTCLREALKRVEGCPACCGKKLLYGHPGAFPVKVDASPYGSTLDVKVLDYGGNIEFSVEINFCPYCGRRLGEEAQDDQTGSP